jgi:hypothetical protein
MGRRKRTRKRKSPGAIQAQRATEENLRGLLEDTHRRVEDFARGVRATKTLEALIKASPERFQAVVDAFEASKMALLEVMGANFKLHRQIQDLEQRVKLVADARAAGLPISPASVDSPTVPGALPVHTDMQFVIELDAQSRLRSLRDRASSAHLCVIADEAATRLREEGVLYTSFAHEFAATSAFVIRANLATKPEQLQQAVSQVESHERAMSQQIHERVEQSANESLKNRALVDRRDRLLNELAALEQ